jgi:L-malate glycosyltransferase
MGLSGKKVLLTTSHKKIGSGGSMQLYLLARELVKAGACVQAVFKESDQKDFKALHLDRLLDLGVAVRFFRTSRWYSPAQILTMRAFLREGSFDIIHTHKGGDLSLVLLASPGLPIPAIVTTRGVNFGLSANRFKYRLRRLDRIIVVSNDSKNVMAGCGVPPEKIRVIYGGVDTERFQPRPERGAAIRRSLDLPESAVVAVMSANLVRQKGHSDYIKAAALLKETHPEAFHLFAGSGDASAFLQEAKERNVADRVRFLGFRTDMEDLFASSDFSVVASVAGEGVSGVLRESLACGVPVITTDVGGTAELVEDGRTGFVVPKSDPPALANAMRRIIEDKETAGRMRDEGRRMVLKNFSAEARAGRIISLYEEIFREKNLSF